MPKAWRIHRNAFYEIRKFYRNVATKYGHTYSINNLLSDIIKAERGIFKIENGLLRRKPTIAKWIGFHMATLKINNKAQWNYAYLIEDEIVYIYDACHSQNHR